jgi:cytochrome c-type biogenesis protein CcmH
VPESTRPRSVLDRLARPGGFAVLAVVVIVLLAIGSVHPAGTTNQQRIARLDATIKCPSCADLSIGQSSAPQAVTLRNQVRTFVDDGWSDQRIDAWVSQRLGSDEILTPSSGLDVLVWVLPLVALAVGLFAIAFVIFRRRHQTPSDELATEDEELVAAALETRSGERV